jgi:hypothetical protein
MIELDLRRFVSTKINQNKETLQGYYSNMKSFLVGWFRKRCSVSLHLTALAD